jgi:hypothetical protein
MIVYYHRSVGPGVVRKYVCVVIVLCGGCEPCNHMPTRSQRTISVARIPLPAAAQMYLAITRSINPTSSGHCPTLGFLHRWPAPPVVTLPVPAPSARAVCPRRLPLPTPFARACTVCPCPRRLCTNPSPLTLVFSFDDSPFSIHLCPDLASIPPRLVQSKSIPILLRY